MKSKLDKNSKMTSGKSKEGSSGSKPKSKPDKPEKTAAPESGRRAKAEESTGKPAKSSAKSPSSTKAEEEKKPRARAESKPAERSASSEAKATGRPAASRAASKSPAPRASAGRTPAAESASDIALEEFSISLVQPGGTKERIWRTKTFQQHPAQREFGFPEVAPELPGGYGEPKLVLMPKDPEYMFCYWELTDSLIESKGREKLPDGNYRETLKINWESKSLFEPNFTFIPVFFWARKWYFGVPQIGQRYQVELGWLSDSGHFISIIQSNLSELPESWVATQKRLAEQGDILAYSSRHTKIIGSSENLAVEDSRHFVPEWNLSSESLSSSSWSRGAGTATPAAAAAPAAMPAAPEKPASRGKATAARLEVSGKVLPGTAVHIGGKAVPVDAQGYFKTEFPYRKDVLNLELSSGAGATRSFTYDLKELVLT